MHSSTSLKHHTLAVFGTTKIQQQITKVRGFQSRLSQSTHCTPLYTNNHKHSKKTTTQATLNSDTATPSTSRIGDEYFSNGDSRPIILFDGVCNLCNGGVNFMLDWDTKGACRFAALQSQAGRKLLQRSGRQPDDISSIVLVVNNTSYIKSEAILRIAKYLSIPFPLLAGLALLVPLGFRDIVYDTVADNRYKVFGYTPQCRLGDDRFNDRFISE